MPKKTLFALILCFIFATSVYAYLSPAMDIMAGSMTVTKNVISGTVLDFDDDDFENLFGDNADSAVIKTLPDKNSGELTLKGSGVKVGQRITEDEFDELVFVPKTDFLGKTELTLERGSVVGRIVIHVLDKANFAPQSASSSIDTQKKIAVFGSFSAADPDGDSLIYEIISYPEHGSVSVTSDGQFVYLPLSDFTGDDEFSYRAVDVFGNKSATRVVDIKVSKPAADIYFNDMKNHWAHGSAIKMASTGLMTGRKVDGKLLFEPDAAMTRGDFLALSLIMAGFEDDVPYASKTVFADDSVIAHNIKSYAQYAYDKGIVSGYDNGDCTVNFEPTGSITKAEAAVIINKILDLKDTSLTVPSYKDLDGIPVWAESAVANLSSVGVINGNSGGSFDAEKVLTRAEGAQMICNAASFVEERKAEPKDRNLFNLFGLLD